MNEAIDVCSDSDLSSDSSWTVLEDNDSTGPTKTNAVVEDASVAITASDIFPEIELIEQDTLTDDASDLGNDSEVTVVVTSLKDDKTEEDDDRVQYGCLTLEEYAHERELVHDYDYDERKGNFQELVAQQPKPEKRKRKKCKSEQVGIMVIVGTVLAVAGVSLLCLLTPNTATLSNKEIEKMQRECGAEAFNRSNTSTAAIPVVLGRNNNKLNLVDSEGLLKKYFKENSTALQKVTDLMKVDKSANNLKSNDLLKDDTDSQCKETPMTGPGTYEEYMKQREQLLEEFKRGSKGKKCQGIATKTKNKKPLTVSTCAGKNETLLVPKLARMNEITLTNSTNVTAILPDPQIQIESSKKNERDARIIYLPAGSSKQINKTVVNPIPETKQTSALPKLTKCPTCIVNARFNQTNTQMLQNKNQTEPKGKKGLGPQDSVKVNVVDHRKAACEILQDIMLLRMTSEVAKGIRKKCTKKEKSQKNKQPQACKDHETESQESIKPVLGTQSSGNYINDFKRLVARKYTKNASNKTLRLLDELPFSQRRPSSGEESQDGGNPDDKQAEAIWRLRKQSSDNNCQNRGCRSLVTLNLSQGEGNTNSATDSSMKAKLQYLDEIESQQKDRLQYLRLARERQQKSVKSFMKDRRVEMERYKDVGCGKYQVPIPSAAEVSKRLMELNNRGRTNQSSSFTFQGSQGNPPSCHPMCRFNRKKISDPAVAWTSNCYSSDLIRKYRDHLIEKQEIGHLKLPELQERQSPKFWPKQTECIKCSRQKENLNLRVPPEYIDMKRKYYERVSSYWKKREEYLEQRMEFMKKVSGSVQEIMSNYRNAKKNSQGETGTNEEAMSKIITEATAVFPDDPAIQSLRRESFSREESASNISDNSISRELRGGRPSAGECSSSTKDSSFEFAGNQSQLVCCKNAKIKDNAFYTGVFGKKGHQIRKRDLAVWYLNKMAKRKKSNETSKHVPKRGGKYKKHKKEVVGN